MAFLSAGTLVETVLCLLLLLCCVFVLEINDDDDDDEIRNRKPVITDRINAAAGYAIASVRRSVRPFVSTLSSESTDC